MNQPPRTRLALLALFGVVLIVALIAHRISSPVSPSRDPHVDDSSTRPEQSGAPGTPPRPTASPSTVPLTAAAAHQLQTLDQILLSRNDNDPRLDTELRNLDESAKAALKTKYRAMPAEKRNDRGTVVFLLGRNLTTAADYGFLKEVLTEAPCLSMADCARMAPTTPGDADADNNGIGIVLAYPQLNALRAISSASRDPAALTPELLAAAQEAIDAAKKSGSPIVADLAEKSSVGSPPSPR